MHDQQDYDMRIWNLAQGGEDSDLERHVATCEACRQELTTLRHLAHMRQVTGGALSQPSEALAVQLRSLLGTVRPDLVAQQTSAVERVLGHLRRITAELLLDSAAQPQLAGLRSATDRGTRQLVFVSDLADLDLEVTSGDDGFLVAGQFGMDDVPEGLHIRFTPGEGDPLADDLAGAVHAAIADNGYFQVRLGTGDWVASVVLDDAVLVFPGVRL